MDEDIMPIVSLSVTTIHFRIRLILPGDGQYWAPNDQQARSSEMVSYVCLPSQWTVIGADREHLQPSRLSHHAE